ncbi:uracil-DNA glycosylase family protein [Bacteroidota bacterium]
MNLANQIVDFLFSLNLDIRLPDGIRVMNPYLDPVAKEVVRTFYQTYYKDKKSRKLILAINPGRLGAGTTGIPFTDTKRLTDVCGINSAIPETHEPSSVFVYDVIEAYGGPEKFYQEYFIGSVCPLGFLKKNEKGNWINYNYYDETQFTKLVSPFIVSELRKLLLLPLERTTCICWGTGKNYKYLSALNAEHKFFRKVIPLEHPRYIMQYKSKQKSEYIQKYLDVFHSI